MGGRHPVHVVQFAGRGFLAVEFLAVPAADAALAQRDFGDDRSIGFAEHHIRPVGTRRIRLDFGLGVRYRMQIVRRVIARTIVLVIAAATGTGRRQHRNRLLRPCRLRSNALAGGVRRNRFGQAAAAPQQGCRQQDHAILDVCQCGLRWMKVRGVRDDAHRVLR